jgi:phosphate/sulfate permease
LPIPETSINFVIFLIALALAFDFVNGFHDAANSIATVVSTRVLTPLQGVAWVVAFNFIAAFTFGTAVAKTIVNGMVDVQKVDNLVILGGLAGAILRDLITWRLGLPTNSSHALIGGYAGAITLFTASSFGIPVSTTHTIAGGIVGVGMIRRLQAVRWGVAGRIVWAWVLTIPAAGLLGAGCYSVTFLIQHLLGG